MSNCVIDASALLALLQEEPGADRTAAALPNATISSVNLSEVVSKLADKAMPLKLIRETLQSLDLDVYEFDEELAYGAGGLRPATAGLGLSLGDRACLALAQRLKCPVLTSDASWAQVDVTDVDVELIR